MADIAGNQRRVLGEFLAQLRPHWHTDPGLPARIERLIRGDRRLGSRDRRLYRELIYTTLRYLNWIEPWLGSDFAVEAIAWLAADLPATRSFKAAFGGTRSPGAPGQTDFGQDYAPPPWPPCPPSLPAKAEILAARRGDPGAELPSLLPAWAPAECPAALQPAEYEALHRRAPLWIRMQGDRTDLVLEEFTARHWHWTRSDRLDGAVRIDSEVDLTDTLAFQTGMIEIQDLGSQLILPFASPVPGTHWLDACAGAGGKSLQLGSLLGPSGRVAVNDVRPAALAELNRRAERSHLGRQIARADLTAGAPLYDGVLVDAPCTGSGTWRRSPHLKAVTTPAQIGAAAELQSRLLEQFSRWVKPGGQLVYATCSLCVRENEAVAEAFLALNPAFAAGASRPFLPSEHDGDGFFVATFRRLP